MRQRVWSAPPPRAAICRLGVVVGLLSVSLLGGCGGQSIPAPVSPGDVLSNLLVTSPACRDGCKSVLVTSGHGSRRFAGVSWPREVAVWISCRGGRTVQATLGQLDLTAGCAPGQSGGATNTTGPASTLVVSATHQTRWSLAVVVALR